LDTPSAEPGQESAKNASSDTGNADKTSAGSSAVSSGNSDETAGPSNGIPGPESVEASKVLAYGPAHRPVEAPEIKAHRTPESGEAPAIKADHEAQKAVEPEVSARKPAGPGSALIPFVSKTKDESEDASQSGVPRGRFDILRSRGMQAALLAACIGVAWAFAGSLIAGHSVQAPPQRVAGLADGSEIHRQTASSAPDTAETHRLAEDIRALKKELDGLRASMAQSTSAEELRTLKKSVDALKNGLEGTKSEVGSSLAQLSAKLDRAQHDPAKLREISDRLDHIERAIPLTTASTAAVPQPEPPVKAAPAVPLTPAKAQTSVQPQNAATKSASTQNPVAQAASEKPQLITNWVVRDVYDGIALVEGPHGSIEVIEGETIPGVGTVKSIERRGSGWIVVTSRGLVDSARN